MGSSGDVLVLLIVTRDNELTVCCAGGVSTGGVSTSGVGASGIVCGVLVFVEDVLDLSLDLVHSSGHFD